MTDKKFTDDEIIKALVLCNKPLSTNYCESCPISSDYRCLYTLKANALDLINRQKAEIKRLKECPRCVYEYDGEVMEYCVQGPCSNLKTVEQIKSEAYKEFAEKLENEINRRTTLSRKQDKNVIHIMHNLLKEMAGEEK